MATTLLFSNPAFIFLHSITVPCYSEYWSLIQHFNSFLFPFNQSSDWLPLTPRRLEQLVGGASFLTVTDLWLSFPL